MTTEKEIEHLLKALANRRRIAILRLLKAEGTQTVGNIAATIKLSVKATSRHLQILRSGGFITSDQQGLFVYYSLTSVSGRTARALNLIL